MGRKQQGVFVALLRGPFLAIGNDFGVGIQALIVAFDLRGVSQDGGGEAAD